MMTVRQRNLLPDGLPVPAGENWVRLTELAAPLGVSEQRVRDLHEAMGRPFERVEKTRGKPVIVDSPRWLRVWAAFATHCGWADDDGRRTRHWRQ